MTRSLMPLHHLFLLADLSLWPWQPAKIKLGTNIIRKTTVKQGIRITITICIRYLMKSLASANPSLTKKAMTVTGETI